MKFEIRSAAINDIDKILFFIKELAIYEKLEHEVIATEKKIQETLFGDNSNAEVIFAMENDREVGFALFFQNYSTFLAKPGIYLEDLFILPEHRSKGYGKKLLIHLAKIAIKRNCGRLEWSVLDWNEPAINFYKSLSAKPMDEWTVFRLSGENLLNLANQK